MSFVTFNSIYFISDRDNVLETGIINKPKGHHFYQTDIYSLEVKSRVIKRLTEFKSADKASKIKPIPLSVMSKRYSSGKLY